MTERLTCRAPHPDPRKPGEVCGAELPVPSEWRYVGTMTRYPTPSERDPDGAYVRCARHGCPFWHKFIWREQRTA